MSQGVIENGDERTYCSLRDRPDAMWFNETMRYALSQKLWDTNETLGLHEQEKYNKKQRNIMNYYRLRSLIAKPIKKILGRT